MVMTSSISMSLEESDNHCELQLRAEDLSPLEFRLLFANRIVEQSWNDRKVQWSCEDIGVLLIEVLEDEFGFDWSSSVAIETFKSLLGLAFVAAGDVLPAWQRKF